MKYSIKNITLTALAAICFVAGTFCMEAESKILAESTQMFMFLHTIDFCDHAMLCKLARVNTQLYKVIKEAAPSRKKCIEQNMTLKPFDPLQWVVWHPYGSAYGFIEPKEQRSFGLSEYWVQLNQVSLGYNKKIESLSLAREKKLGQVYCLEHVKCDENGAMSFYYARYNYSHEVLEISSFAKGGIAQSNRCAVSFSDSSGYSGSLYKLVRMPNLFRAFIHSSVILTDESEESRKFFNLNGVTIPDNYKESPRFADLSPEWRQAIIDRYQKQQSKK